MTHKFRKTPLASVLLACLLAPVGLAAQSAATLPVRVQDVSSLRPRRAVAPMVLRLPASARTLAMANAGVASTDADALLYNPGMLSAARGASVSIQTYGSGGTAGSLATVSVLGSLSFGVGAQFVRWNVGPTQPGREDERYRERLLGGGASMYGREGIRSSSSAFTLGIARTIKGLRLGASAKFAEDRIGLSNDGTVAFDIGMVRPLGPGNLAITAQNLGFGTRLDGQESVLPRRLGVGYGGAGYPLSTHWDLAAQAQLTMENDFFRPAGGVELAYVPIEGVSFAVRTGLRLPRESNESLVTGGIGASVDRFSLDYAFEPFRNGFAVSHRLGMRIR
ncbi:MAG TPA: hypothetical protein VE869_15440 [Gemmatimonas sp.]|nr:hypothetical protein [Gemmatimonas sp.]